MNSKLYPFFPVFLIFSLFQIGCEDSTGPVTPVGYEMKELHFEYELPCYVNVMFQVTDRKMAGIPNLKTEDFVVYEDDMEYSPTESFPIIRKRENIPYALQTVLLLDNSASVGANLGEIKAAAVTMIGSITANQKFAIYKFSETPVLVQDFTNNISDLTDAINSIQLGYATTDLYGAIMAGVERWTDYYALDSIQQGFMIALTDGSDTQHLHTLAEALQARGDKRIYTVGLGAEIDPDILGQLGNAGFYQINDVSGVVESFTNIQNASVNWANSFYWLNYMSPTRGDIVHQFRLGIVNNPNTDRSGYILNTFSSDGFFSVLGGLYINATGELPYGISHLDMYTSATLTLEATTYLPDTLPNYKWRSTDESVVTISVNDNDNSLSYITALGAVSEEALIIVNDSTNALFDTLTIAIIAK